MNSLLVVLGALILAGLMAAHQGSRAAPQRDPDPVYRSAVREKSATEDLELRVQELERAGQRERDRKNAELFAPQYPQRTMVPFEPSYRSLEPLAPPAPRARDLGF